MKPLSTFNQGLIDFLNQSPTPFHAVKEMIAILTKAGFSALEESEQWQLEEGKAYFVTRNQSSIIAFRYWPKKMQAQGIPMIGAHTDSPCLKVKPNPEIHTKGYFQLGVETYGGALLNPWFDRDLSIAGRVSFRNDNGQLQSALINFQRPIAMVPSLAIHLHREANEGNKINKQKHMPPVLLQAGSKEKIEFRELIQEQLRQEGYDNCELVLDYDLYFYDTQSAAVIGFNEEFFASARLDNLLSCYIGLQSLISADASNPGLLVCNDHEEVGSASACGAQGPMLEHCLQRLLPDTEKRIRCIDNSLMISADNAHGIHPNYVDKHDGNHGPLLNRGPVIKINANQGYATSSETSSIFKALCQQLDVPVQEFVTRSDMGCGSTIGPITATEVGVKTLDVGLPTFGMHSIRELAGASDGEMLLKVFTGFLSAPVPVIEKT
jgi:aspartyl aminopeptidase